MTPTPGRIETLAQALVDKLDVVHASPDMQAVWVLQYVHGGRYTGPNYANELAALRAALSTPHTPPPSADPYSQGLAASLQAVQRSLTQAEVALAVVAVPGLSDGVDKGGQ